LRSARLAPMLTVPGETKVRGQARPLPAALIDASGPALIQIYPSVSAADQTFARLHKLLPVMQDGNVLITFPVTPQPTRGILSRLEACSFGADARPSVGPVVGISDSSPRSPKVFLYPVVTRGARTGPAIIAQTGCLACHRIGSSGTNNSVGDDLTNIGDRLTRAEITYALRAPTPPMPSYRRLPNRALRILVNYLTELRSSR
jgi:hypothetical protein